VLFRSRGHGRGRLRDPGACLGYRGLLRPRSDQRHNSASEGRFRGRAGAVWRDCRLAGTECSVRCSRTGACRLRRISGRQSGRILGARGQTDKRHPMDPPEAAASAPPPAGPAEGRGLCHPTLSPRSCVVSDHPPPFSGISDAANGGPTAPSAGLRLSADGRAPGASVPKALVMTFS
jgi:hypothetical protein